MTTSRHAFLGLDKLFKRKDKVPAAPDSSKAHRFQAKWDDVRDGAYFYIIEPKGVQMMDITGEPYKERIPKGKHVEATGRKAKTIGLVEVRYKNSKVWVQLKDLVKPLQSKKQPDVRVAWANPNSLSSMFKELCDTGEEKKALKITSRMRKAVAATVSMLTSELDDWTVEWEGETMAASEAVTSWIGGLNQQKALLEIQKAIKNRTQLVRNFKNTKANQAGSTRVVDHFILAGAFLAIMAKGSTEGRAKFALDTICPYVHRAGGSLLEKKITAIFVRNLGDEAKPSKKGKKKTAASQTERSEQDAHVLNRYVKPAQSGHGTKDGVGLFLHQMLGTGPSNTWDTGTIDNPYMMVDVLCATPDGVQTPRIEKSKQLLKLTELLKEAVGHRVRLDTVVHRPSDATCTQLVEDAVGSSVDDVRVLLHKCMEPSWYNELVNVSNGRYLSDTRAIEAMRVMLSLHLAFHATSDEARAKWLRAAIHRMHTNKLVDNAVLTNKIVTAFTWANVLKMLEFRLGEGQ